MKKVNTILLLTIASLCKGQNGTTLTTPATSLKFSNASTYYSWELPHTKDFDTTSVLLICIDAKENETGPTFWVKAVKIKKYVSGSWNNDSYRAAHWAHYTYLTKEMKPLNLTVVQEL